MRRLTVRASFGWLLSSTAASRSTLSTTKHLARLYSSLSFGEWTVWCVAEKHSTAASSPAHASRKRKNCTLWKRTESFSEDPVFVTVVLEECVQ